MLFFMLLTSLAVTGCSKLESGDAASAYDAACVGLPLRDMEVRNKAMEDGYNIDQRYNCVDKASFLAVKEQTEMWKAANTPDAKALRAAELKKRIEVEQAQSRTRVEAQERMDSQPSTASQEVVRCTSANGGSSTLQHGQCAPGETRVPVAVKRSLMEKSDTNTALIKCTSRDGKTVSIQRGNCASPDDYQQLLGDR